MCGISGFNWSDRLLIEKMNERLAHRGPDDAGAYIDREVSLGHKRLSIIDLSSKGQQPMMFKNLVITFNGEIYNYRELSKELQAHGFRPSSQSDTEIILAAYHTWGVECLKKFNGIFAFAIYDKLTKELLLARDHLGIKPLYYYQDNPKFIFASEIKALLAYKNLRKLNTQSLNFLLRVLYVPEPETMFQGIKKLKSGHYAIVKNGVFREFKYWDIDTNVTVEPNIHQSMKDLHSLLRDAVTKQLVTDRPLGVWLSGGWDSTALLGLMREQGVEDIATFTSGFETVREKYNQDLLLARQTAKYYSTNHHEFILPSTLISSIIEKVVYHLDEPNASPTVIPMYYLAEQTKKDVTVVLGGDGGDELFAGYPRFTQSFYLNRFQKIPKSIRNGVVPYALLEKIFNKKELKRKLNTPPGYDRFALFKVHSEKMIRNMLRPELFNESVVPEYYTQNFFNKNAYADFEKTLMYMDVKNWLTVESLWKSDHLTMAAALEYRVPLLDYRLVELAFRMPTHFKVKNFSGKWIFKQVVKQYVPKNIQNIRKRGWLTPGTLWLQDELKDVMQSVVAAEYCPAIADYFNIDYIRKMYREHRAGNTRHMNQLWTLLTFAIWYNIFFRSDSL